jgi:phosphoribosylanthranilate isomerase
MTLRVKICGLNAPQAVTAAVAGGASHVGLIFYPPSPRYVTPDEAAQLAGMVPDGVATVGLFVDGDDDAIEAVLRRVPLDMLQLHGSEPPERAAELRQSFGLPVMKAIKVAVAEDLDQAAPYESVVDWLLFDAKPPPDMQDALPGGNALAFEWALLSGRHWRRPAMLSGGLSRANLEEAVRISGARAVDVSSGVEDRPGCKNPDKIRAFLDLARGL